MEKRYQVFVSSTYDDLIPERRSIIERLLAIDCIPAGMELFPASDDEQFEFIKKVIDDCDYYILIIGGKYGSESSDGISYTEMEYDYALSKGIPILSFVHKRIDELPSVKVELDSVKREKLEQFKNKVTLNRLVKFWSTISDLQAEVVISMSHALKVYPRVGWIKGNTSNNEKLLEQINSLRDENKVLNQRLLEFNSTKFINEENLAFGDEQFHIYGEFRANYYGTIEEPWDEDVSWKTIYSRLAPLLYSKKDIDYLKTLFEANIKNVIFEEPPCEYTIDNHVFQTIRIQFEALGLIETIENENYEYLVLTPLGKKELMRTMTIKSNSKKK